MEKSKYITQIKNTKSHKEQSIISIVGGRGGFANVKCAKGGSVN